MGKQKNFRRFYDSLPILGKDGSLAETGPDWPAAGKLRAKTGTRRCDRRFDLDQFWIAKLRQLKTLT
jgi:D-Ala-D-Ala carboxypeptidase 3 (S13) family